MLDNRMRRIWARFLGYLIGFSFVFAFVSVAGLALWAHVFFIRLVCK